MERNGGEFCHDKKGCHQIHDEKRSSPDLQLHVFCVVSSIYFVRIAPPGSWGFGRNTNMIIQRSGEERWRILSWHLLYDEKSSSPDLQLHVFCDLGSICYNQDSTSRFLGARPNHKYDNTTSWRGRVAIFVMTKKVITRFMIKKRHHQICNCTYSVWSIPFILSG